MRHPLDGCYHVELSEAEMDFADVMMAQVGLTSRSDLLRLGLWHLAKHLDVPVGNQVFAVRGKRERRQAAVGAEADSVSPPPAPRVLKDRRRGSAVPAADHPWRGRKVSA